ncbi:MAG: hypothetical protein ACYCT9_10235 [Leptospirillum sp.]
MEFSPHAVAYLDILGFSDFVEEAEKDNDKLKSLDKLFNEVIPKEISSEGKNSVFPQDLKLKSLSCSDSLVISAPVSDESPYPSLIAVSIKAIQIAHALLDMGFLVRGGIAVGNVYRTDSNILGTGYQEAVKEDKGNPRIVLTESAKQELKKLKNEGSIYWNSSFFSKDELRQTILNSIHPFQSYLPDKDGDPVEYFNKYRETILKNISKDNQKDEGIRQKWFWCAGLFNANVKQLFSSLTSKTPPPPIDIDEKSPTIILNYLNQELDPNWAEAFKAPGYVVRFNKSI